MVVYTYKEPFWHTIIQDYYTPEEESLIWQELEFLNMRGKFLEPEFTGDLRSENKIGCVLREVFKDLNFSSINTINQKLLSEEMYLAINRNPLTKYLKFSSIELITQIQYYLNGGNYKKHQDMSILSAVCLFHKQPKMYTGGELVFGDYVAPLKHNTLILFPSCEWHNVQPISVNDLDASNGLSRYTICQFVSISGNINTHRAIE